MVLVSSLEFVRDRKPKMWVEKERFHHQYMPDILQFEKNGLSADIQDRLRSKGHVIKEINRRYGNMQAILWHKTENKVYAASDPRGEGSAQKTRN